MESSPLCPMTRSLKVRQEYTTKIKTSLLKNGFPSQKILAENLAIAQSTISNFLNAKPVDFVNFLEICRILGLEWRDIADLDDQFCPETTPTNLIKKIWLSYSHSDTRLAIDLQQNLQAAGYEIFGNNSHIPADIYLKQSDYFVLLLSEHTNISEMILEQIRLVKDLHNNTPQKPAILPICLDLPWQCEISFDLLGYLAEIQPWHWQGSNNINILTRKIIDIIKKNRTTLSLDKELAIQWHHIINTNNQSQKSVTNYYHPLPTSAPEIPEGQVNLDSHFYIDRPPIETRCYETISQPGSLIRIKAPRQMGKTSLMARILHHAENQGSKTVALSFQLANQRVFSNSNTFLQWFCANVSLELGLLDRSQLEKYTDLAEIIGSNQSCKAYFEQYLLPQINQPLTLGLDEVDRIFESHEIADDFFGLLRSLHEEAKRRDIWKNFRLIVVHSTEVYIPLDVNKSPFNVGLPIELPEFTPQQVQELAQRYQLDWPLNTVEKIMNLVGGHPYLLRLAMYAITQKDITLPELLENATTETGIYSDHLRRMMWNLEKYPELKLAMQQIVDVNTPVRLPSVLAFKLNSMGLIKLQGNDCTTRCYLYYQYFRDRLI